MSADDRAQKVTTAVLAAVVDELRQHFGQCHGGVFSMVGSWVFSMVGSSCHGYTIKGRVEGWIEPPVLSYILQRPLHS